MSYEIHSALRVEDDFYCEYEDKPLLNVVVHDGDLFIDDIEVLVVQKQDQSWWIIPNDATYDEDFEARGPFDTVEAALVTMKLIAEVA